MITTNSGKLLSKNANDWKFNHPTIPKRINELFLPNDTDSLFVIFSNQLNLNSKIAERANFESKIDSVISKLGISNKCPVICLFSTRRDEHRKPCVGMWRVLENEFFAKFNCKINMKESFFVGDAAGRLASWKPGRSADWSAVDRKFATNLGLKFYTPEEFVFKEEIVEMYDLGRDPKTLTATISAEYSSDSESEIVKELNTVSMVLAVGSPASGKSTYYQRHLKALNFVHVNRDTLKTIPKCLALVKSSLLKKQSVYIDNTNPTRESREMFISIAKDLNIPVICLQFTADEWLSKHLDVYRSIKGKIDPLPGVVFNSFRSKYQPPVKDEGFEKIIQLPFEINFASNDDLELFRSYLF